MKKNSIFKAIIVAFLVYVVASWIIPGGVIQNGAYVKGDISPVGLADIFIYPLSTLSTSIFVMVALVVLLIGALYGVLNRTGAYSKLIENIAKKFKGKEKSFLVISVILFAVLSSLTTLTLPILIIVPLFIAVILTLGFSKMTAFLSTIVPMLVGNMATLFGYNMDGYSYTNYFYGVKSADNMLFKAILLVVATGILVFYVVKTSKLAKKTAKKTTKKVEEKKEEIVIPFVSGKNTTKKSEKGIVITLSILFVLAIVGLFNWAGAFELNKTIFDTLHENITKVTINNFAILSNIIGQLNPLGYWSNYELAMLLVIATFVVGKVYKLKCNEILDSAVEGIKEMLPVAFVAALAGILLLVVNSVTATFMPTIFNFFIGLTKNLNAFSFAALSAIGSVTYSQFPYLMNALYDPVSTLYAENIKQAVYVMQVMFGYTMLLVPTSVGLVIGLQLLGISYKEWLKENWKLLLSLLVVGLILSVLVVLI